MKLSSRAYNLFDAFSKPGCPICRLTFDSVHHYLDSLVYEYVNKPATHEMVRAARGFCPRHAWHVQEAIGASALGIAVLYEGVIRHLLDDMGNQKPNGGRRQIAQAAGALKPQGDCPACTHQAITEDHLIRNLLEHLDQDEFAARFSQSEGMCLPHLRQALDQQGKTAAKAHLLALQQDIWSQLQQNLAEFMRKNDTNFADEGLTDDEGTSPRRAIEQMSGLKGVK